MWKRSVEQAGLADMVSAETVEDWFRHGDKEHALVPATAIMGLFGQDVSQEQMELVIGAVHELGNATPSPDLDGRAPRDVQRQGHRPDIRLTCIQPGGMLIADVAEAAEQAMKKADYATASRLFASCFEKLLAHNATVPEPYRLYANYAVTLAASGKLDLAEEINEIGLDLNPNYDFGLDLADRLAGERRFLRLRRKRAALSEDLDNDPAVAYDDYLAYLGINFSTSKLTTSKRINLPLVPKAKKR
jgi:tetratricopeptide (TPR) repeat protein